MKFSQIEWWSKLGLTTKMLVVFLALSVISLGVMGSSAHTNIWEVSGYALENIFALGDSAANDSANALVDQAEKHLLSLAKDQASITNALFEKAEGEINIIAKYASTLWSNPTSFGYRTSYSGEEIPVDVYATSVYSLAPDIAIHAVREELNLSSNLDDIFIPIYANDSNLTRVYLGTESGITRLYPWFSGIEPSYDSRKRDWYKRAIETGEIGWTELYIDASGSGLMVSCSKPVYNPEGKTVGVVGIDITLKAMNEKIINTQIGELGYAFLIDNEGQIIARPELSPGDKRWDETFKTENLLQSDNLGLRKIAWGMTSGNTEIARCTFQDGEKYIAYAPITCTNWSIGILMPVEEIIAPALATKSRIISDTEDAKKHINSKISNLQNIFFVFFIAMLLVVSGLAFLLSRSITKPILKLTHAARAMERGELEEDEIARLSQSKGKDEVASLSRVFASMATKVKARESRLKRQVEELRIEIDEVKKAKEITRITESDYFQHLQETARKIREKLKEE